MKWRLRFAWPRGRQVAINATKRYTIPSLEGHVVVLNDDMYRDSYETIGIKAMALMAACGGDVLVMGLDDLLEMVSNSADAEAFLERFALQAAHARASGTAPPPSPVIQ